MTLATSMCRLACHAGDAFFETREAFAHAGHDRLGVGARAGSIRGHRAVAICMTIRADARRAVHLGAHAVISRAKTLCGVPLFADVPAEKIAGHRVVETFLHLLLDLGKGVFFFAALPDLFEVADLGIRITRNAWRSFRIVFLAKLVAEFIKAAAEHCAVTSLPRSDKA